MTTFRQIEANRRNALKSTGPTSDEGKLRSRRNAVRHGLTAETVIAELEDAEDYKAFELAVTSGFDVTTAVERELVLRLASLLWRLRRATAIETGLLQLQHDIIAVKSRQHIERARECLNTNPTDECSEPAEKSRFHPMDNRDGTVSCLKRTDPDGAQSASNNACADVARCFLRLINLDNGAFERANRYETALWRQLGQTLLTLDFLRRDR